MSTPTAQAPRLLRLPEVKARTGLSRSHIYTMEQRGEFPRRVKICSARASGWLESEISAWIESRVAERDARHAA